LYKRSQLLLLDEATAAMGRRTEHFVIELLQRIKAEMAIILVTHRPQLARYADRIYVIENKTISASGNHCELVDINPFYSDAFLEYVK
jgi:ATP-binding cassette subfamily B protein